MIKTRRGITFTGSCTGLERTDDIFQRLTERAADAMAKEEDRLLMDLLDPIKRLIYVQETISGGLIQPCEVCGDLCDNVIEMSIATQHGRMVMRSCIICPRCYRVPILLATSLRHEIRMLADRKVYMNEEVVEAK